MGLPIGFNYGRILVGGRWDSSDDGFSPPSVVASFSPAAAPGVVVSDASLPSVVEVSGAFAGWLPHVKPRAKSPEPGSATVVEMFG